MTNDPVNGPNVSWVMGGDFDQAYEQGLRIELLIRVEMLNITGLAAMFTLYLMPFFRQCYHVGTPKICVSLCTLTVDTGQ